MVIPDVVVYSEESPKSLLLGSLLITLIKASQTMTTNWNPFDNSFDSRVGLLHSCPYILLFTIIFIVYISDWYTENVFVDASSVFLIGNRVWWVT